MRIREQMKLSFECALSNCVLCLCLSLSMHRQKPQRLVAVLLPHLGLDREVEEERRRHCNHHKAGQVHNIELQSQEKEGEGAQSATLNKL